MIKDDRINSLSNTDKELLRKAVFATIRHHAEIDKFISQYAKVDDNGLRLGIALILLLDRPRKEVVDELVAEVDNPKQKSLYLAVLNRLDHKVFKRDAKINFPNWLTGSWRKAYGEEKTAAIAEALLNDISLEKPAKPKADIVIEAPSSQTGLISQMPELLHQLEAENVLTYAKAQNDLLDKAYNELKSGGTAAYTNYSLQYEEGEGLVRKLPKDKWQLLEQKRVLPCDNLANGAIAGSYTAILKKL